MDGLDLSHHPLGPIMTLYIPIPDELREHKKYPSEKTRFRPFAPEIPKKIRELVFEVLRKESPNALPTEVTMSYIYTDAGAWFICVRVLRQAKHIWTSEKRKWYQVSPGGKFDPVVQDKYPVPPNASLDRYTDQLIPRPLPLTAGVPADATPYEKYFLRKHPEALHENL